MAGHGLPPGRPFHPTDNILLQYYLLRRAFSQHGAPPPNNLIRDKVMYGANADPWEIFIHNDHWVEQGNCHFTHAYTLLPRHQRIVPGRWAGCGHWVRLDASLRIVTNRGVSLGTRIFFVFEPRPQSRHIHRIGAWAMCEYTLSPVVNSDWVLCRIFRNDDRTLNGHLAPAPPRPPPMPEQLQSERPAVESLAAD